MGCSSVKGTKRNFANTLIKLQKEVSKLHQVDTELSPRHQQDFEGTQKLQVDIETRIGRAQQMLDEAMQTFSPKAHGREGTVCMSEPSEPETVFANSHAKHVFLSNGKLIIEDPIIKAAIEKNRLLLS